ncbi:hypothetical protein F4803DRAFT_361915 [Xylaria telfairii]|nr:hypothetical protein F4803DRAFT_361915 [Xylaria telfairii]
MELTPITVRGKRRAEGEQLSLDRPKKAIKQDRSQKKQVKIRRPKASEIETSMPLEILERIFWLSENVNFPRASPRLGRLLSGPSTLRKTFLNAFGPTWEVWFGCVNGQTPDLPAIHSYAGWEEDTERFGGNPSFQADLLAYSWTTIDMILDCRDIWVRRYARNRPFQHIPLWGNPIEASSYTGSGATIGISNIKEARFYFYHDYNAFRDVEHMDYLSWSEYLSAPNPSTWVEVHKSTAIPDDLLTGPWDEGSLQKFFWLVQGGVRLSSVQTWEVTREGFRCAVWDQRAPNLTVVRLLSNLGAFQKWPRGVRREEYLQINDFIYNQKPDDDRDLVARYVYLESVLTGVMD